MFAFVQVPLLSLELAAIFQATTSDGLDAAVAMRLYQPLGNVGAVALASR